MNNDPKNQSAQNLNQPAPGPQPNAQQAQDQQVQQPVVSIPVGGAEGAPAHVEKPIQNVENYVAPSEVEPQVSPEVAQYVQPTPRPKIHADAEAAGLRESIPQGPIYGNLPTDQHVALNTFKKGDSGLSNTWRALLALKELARGLLLPKKPQEVN